MSPAAPPLEQTVRGSVLADSSPRMHDQLRPRMRGGQGV